MISREKKYFADFTKKREREEKRLNEIIFYLIIFQVKTKPFQGSGNVLGSIAPTVAENAPKAGSTDAALSESEAQKKLNVDTSKVRILMFFYHSDFM